MYSWFTSLVSMSNQFNATDSNSFAGSYSSPGNDETSRTELDQIAMLIFIILAVGVAPISCALIKFCCNRYEADLNKTAHRDSDTAPLLVV